MAIMSFDLPSYELAPTQDVRDTVLKSLKTGFIYVEHGLDSEYIDSIYEYLESWFDQPTRTKDRCHHFSTTERAEGQTEYDYKEMLNFKFPPPVDHPLVIKYPNSYKPFDDRTLDRGLLKPFADAVLDIQKRVLSVIAEALGAHPAYFDRMVNHGPTLTRAIYYPSQDGNKIWAGAHDDINLITALPKATAKGLQILVDGEWIDAAPPENAMIINTGLMMEHVTNGVIPAGHHRVVSDGSPQKRYSVVQFCHPTPGTVLQPMAACLERRSQKYDAVLAEEMLNEIIWRITSDNYKS